MVILLNTNCCGGKGLEKWNRIKNHILNSETTLLQANKNEVIAKLKESVEKGETQFVAAGGDGTINFLLNSLIGLATSEQLNDIAIGAVGIGSSNDFHKPFSAKIEGIPVCIDFHNSYLSDVGVIKYDSGGSKIEKYFLINSSVGITADANNLFNKSDLILKRLKQFNTKTAILYSAIKTMLTHKNVDAEIVIDGKKLKTKITNLGITKNPHFSGNFCYDSQADYTNGKLDVHLAHDMNKFEMLCLMNALTSNRFSKLKKTKTLQTDRVKITSENNFTVEFDGEVAITKEVEFKIINNYLKVCGNGKSI
jgi:diacylglycerol kinase family enzyme